MKNETRIWLKYAAENLESAKILLQSNLHNPCLQNVQQAVEKALKAILADYEPDEKICRTGIEIAEKAMRSADWIISTK